MNAYNKTPESTRIVRFQDCDPYGHLNNAKYIDYLLNVREDHLREQYDIDVFAMARKDNTSWLVGRNDIVYLRPADVMEEVVVRTALIDYTNRDGDDGFKSRSHQGATMDQLLLLRL